MAKLKIFKFISHSSVNPEPLLIGKTGHNTPRQTGRIQPAYPHSTEYQVRDTGARTYIILP